MMMPFAEQPLQEGPSIHLDPNLHPDRAWSELGRNPLLQIPAGSRGATQAIALIAQAQDPGIRGHSARVASFSVRLAHGLQLPGEQLPEVHLAGLLHDIGKTAVEQQLLCKPEPLTSSEYERIKLHPLLGYLMLAGVQNLAAILPAVLHHHEQWNGCGYPGGLAGEQIPQIARIVAVADAYDAMTSDRPYREGMPLARVQRVFEEGRGVFWDPRVIEAYFRTCHELAELAAGNRFA